MVTLVIAAASVLGCQQNERTLPPNTLTDNSGDDARVILQRYAEAWRGAQEIELTETVVLGFEIDGDGGGEYHVALPSSGSAEVADGLPESGYIAVYTTDIDFLRRLDRGEMSAMTAIGRARMTDPTPLDFRFPPGFRPTQEALTHLIRLHFHFWNRNWPEVIPFGDGMTRLVHGGNAAPFYYDQGLRTSWYQLEPGQHINAEEALQANPFPSLFIMTRGSIQARLDGAEMTLQEGHAVLVPAGMKHEFWAETNQYGELVLIMFGEGA
jgi:mannose-6-phosphate isomerase-like protein (cupin superfamily)